MKRECTLLIHPFVDPLIDVVSGIRGFPPVYLVSQRSSTIIVFSSPIHDAGTNPFGERTPSAFTAVLESHTNQVKTWRLQINGNRGNFRVAGYRSATNATDSCLLRDINRRTYFSVKFWVGGSKIVIFGVCFGRRCPLTKRTVCVSERM